MDATGHHWKLLAANMETNPLDTPASQPGVQRKLDTGSHWKLPGNWKPTWTSTYWNLDASGSQPGMQWGTNGNQCDN
jgi:hypothetical protein